MSIFSNLTFLLKFRAVGGASIAALLLSLGYSEQPEWLTPDQSPAPPTALVAIPNAPPAALPDLPTLPYGAVNDRSQVGFRGSFPLTRVTFNLPVEDGEGLPGGTLDGGGGQIQRGGSVNRQGIALGFGSPAPQGGFGGFGQSAPSVPEPPTWLLIGVGGAMASLYARRKRKAVLAD